MDYVLQLLKSSTVKKMLGDLYVQYGRVFLKKLAEDDVPDLDFDDHVYNVADDFISKFFGVSPDPLLK